MKLVFLICLLFMLQKASAQQLGYFKKDNYFDFSTSFGQRQYATAASWSHLHGIGKSKKIKVGYGIRMTKYLGFDQNFITAPARLTSKKEDISVLFSKTYDENLDTLSIKRSQAIFLNASINLAYQLFPRVLIQFNIDAAGVTFGKERSGDYTSSIYSGEKTDKKAAPTRYNLLLTSDNDIGSLNSEIFGTYWIKPDLGIKVGASYMFVEYKTEDKLAFNNDRFRNKAWMGMIGISYSPKKKTKAISMH
jgi:hypothetical protein